MSSLTNQEFTMSNEMFEHLNHQFETIFNHPSCGENVNNSPDDEDEEENEEEDETA